MNGLQSGTLNTQLYAPTGLNLVVAHSLLLNRNLKPMIQYVARVA